MGTDAELLASARSILAKILANPNAEYSVVGRTFKQQNASELWTLIQELEQRVASGSAGGMKTQLARPV